MVNTISIDSRVNINALSDGQIRLLHAIPQTLLESIIRFRAQKGIIICVKIAPNFNNKQ